MINIIKDINQLILEDFSFQSRGLKNRQIEKEDKINKLIEKFTNGIFNSSKDIEEKISNIIYNNIDDKTSLDISFGYDEYNITENSNLINVLIEYKNKKIFFYISKDDSGLKIHFKIKVNYKKYGDGRNFVEYFFTSLKDLEKLITDFFHNLKILKEDFSFQSRNLKGRQEEKEKKYKDFLKEMNVNNLRSYLQHKFNYDINVFQSASYYKSLKLIYTPTNHLKIVLAISIEEKDMGTCLYKINSRPFNCDEILKTKEDVYNLLSEIINSTKLSEAFQFQSRNIKGRQIEKEDKENKIIEKYTNGMFKSKDEMEKEISNIISNNLNNPTKENLHIIFDFDLFNDDVFLNLRVIFKNKSANAYFYYNENHNKSYDNGLHIGYRGNYLWTPIITKQQLTKAIKTFLLLFN